MPSYTIKISTLKIGFVLFIFLFCLNACTNQNVKGAYPMSTPKTVEGAGLGAVTGAAVGGITQSFNSAALVGAIAGAMIGAPIGSYYDQQGLISTLQAQSVNVVLLGDIVEIDIPADLLFDGGEVELKRSAHPVLHQVTAYLQQYGPVGMAIEGYSDGVGSTFQKLRKSELQAQSVASYLWTHGVNLERIHFEGLGDSITVANDRMTLGSAFNRRVTITLWRDEAPSPFKTYAKLKREDCWTRDDPDNCY